MSKIRIFGVSLIQKNIEAVGKDVERKAKQEIAAAASTFLSGAIQDVPVDTGALRASIKTEQTQAGLGFKATAGGETAPYAPYVEFGTGGYVEIPEGWEPIAAQFKGRGIKKVNLSARPYFVPNFNKAAKQFIDKMKKKARLVVQ